MPHTHHSHSGQFCNHAVDTLQEVVDHAFDVRRMTVIALTEHMPRPAAHLYPGEAESGWGPAEQARIFDHYVAVAAGVRARVAAARDAPGAPEEAQSRTVMVGFEGEWIDAEPEVAAGRIRDVLARHPETFDYWLGSVHHVAGQPIDYDDETYGRAVEACGGEDALWETYFDVQHQLITTLQPPVVGHFDLIRLKSKQPDRDLTRVAGGMVWARIMRNLQAVKAYGGVLEINSSGLRKGLEDPYPRKEVLRAWRNIDGDVVLSDDSHGIKQVGACYDGVLKTLEACGFRQVAVLEASGDAQHPKIHRLGIEQLRMHRFWSAEASR